MKKIGSGIYEFDTPLLAIKIATSLMGRELSTGERHKLFVTRKVKIIDGVEKNIKAFSLLSNAIENQKCRKISTENQMASKSVNHFFPNHKKINEDNIVQPYEIPLKIDGLTLKPIDAERYVDDLMFDGTGRIIGVKRDLSNDELKNIEKLAIPSLSETASQNDRTHSKSPVESLLHFNYLLSKAQPSKVINEWRDSIREFWLEGDISSDRLKSFYQSAITIFEYDVTLIKEIQRLLTDLEKKKYPAQLYDNFFGRIFNSELGRYLVENPTDNAIKTAKKTAAFLGNFVEKFDQCSYGIIKEGNTKSNVNGFDLIAFGIEGDKDFWFPKSFLLNEFIKNPSKENFNLCLNSIVDGFDVMKISKLIIHVLKAKDLLIAANESKEVIGDYDQFHKIAAHYYKNIILKNRTANNKIMTDLEVVSNDTDIIPTKGQAVVIKRDDIFKTNNYGSKLRYHPKNDEDTSNTNYTVSASDKKTIPSHDKSSPFERNMLNSGQALGLGLSGTTNLSCFLYREIKKEHPSFSEEQAFFNTLAYVLYTGGHSVADCLLVYKAIKEVESMDSAAPKEIDKKFKEIIETSLVKTKELIDLQNKEDKNYIRNGLYKAFNEMEKAYEKYAYSAL
ncbi:MAG: hypothetical protein PUP46_11025 [Endozoicomonas sp. (ex Botrylloides leachii)]|nr:hypothetical protein [Endozoicomonas sp. (ex Botrylloides leachii)]